MTLACDRSFLYVDWDFQVEIGLLNVFVQEQQATCVNLQVGVWHFELFVGEQTELVLDELNPFLNPFEIFGKGLAFLTFLKELQTLDKCL